MAKVEKVTLSLDTESKRLISKLTRALDNLSKVKHQEVIRRLTEPAIDGELTGFEEGATIDQPGSVDGAYPVPNVHAQNVAAMEALR